MRQWTSCHDPMFHDILYSARGRGSIPGNKTKTVSPLTALQLKECFSVPFLMWTHKKCTNTTVDSSGMFRCIISICSSNSLKDSNWKRVREWNFKPWLFPFRRAVPHFALSLITFSVAHDGTTTKFIIIIFPFDLLPKKLRERERRIVGEIKEEIG